MLARHAAVRIRAAADCAAGKPLRRLEQKQREQGGALRERAYDDMLVRCVRSVSQGAEAVRGGGQLAREIGVGRAADETGLLDVQAKSSGELLRSPEEGSDSAPSQPSEDG